MGVPVRIIVDCAYGRVGDIRHEYPAMLRDHLRARGFVELVNQPGTPVESAEHEHVDMPKQKRGRGRPLGAKNKGKGD